ncbi:30S ribosomal protein S20 [candidate division KSB3 bacterium]|uniref:Small ribosomal subunit protein bS20 n=1 Tax=candidate division KSB3 bacterium TaxID=2044937 RepID=A0A2G6KBY9_9BACT|nr:MAG: 30S ribosomal protein S20 [candidate division KSB3 bacterium]
MANHKSALKKIRQDEVRRMRNKAYKTRLKNVVKTVETAISDQNKEVAEKALYEAIRVIDSTASKGVIHKNKAARKKSRLTKKVNAIAASA